MELPPQPKIIPPSTTVSLPEKLLTPAVTAPVHHGTSWGAIIGIVIIILVLIVGGLYFWGAKLAREDATQSTSAVPLQTEVSSDIIEEPATFPEVTDDIPLSPDITDDTNPADITDEAVTFPEMIVGDGFTPETEAGVAQ